MIAESEEELPYRDELPFLKDPEVKISVWAIIKDNLGKDLSKMTVPVFMNSPVSAIQQSVALCEYNFMFDQAAEEECSLKRLGLVCANIIAGYSVVEKGNQKPFNPLLGETFEHVTPDWRLVME